MEEELTNELNYAVYSHYAELTSRIEDQLIKKFNDKFDHEKNNTMADKLNLNEKELTNMMIRWLDYWIEERPCVMKDENEYPVLSIKNHLCDIRIKAIYNQSIKWRIDKNLIEHYNGLLDSIIKLD
jgi:hypothetical protein